MKERPILFSAPMVRAILAGTKSITRRIVKPQPDLNTYDGPGAPRPDAPESHRYHWPSHLAKSMVDVRDMGSIGPYGAKGDRLWVRETHAFGPICNDPDDWRDNPDDWAVFYRADGDERPWKTSLDEDAEEIAPPWRPSIFMPRWASRIALEVVSVRVERLHEITEEDARAEGVTPYVPGHGAVTASELAAEPGIRSPMMYRFGFEQVWCDINGTESWRANPWVWRVEFKRTTSHREGKEGGER